MLFINSISAIIQAQIFEDESSSETLKNKYPEFDLSIMLPPELGGNVDHVPECVLNHESLNDTELREKIIDGCVPTVDTIFRFVISFFLKA